MKHLYSSLIDMWQESELKVFANQHYFISDIEVSSPS
jgi:hypothetical protein